MLLKNKKIVIFGVANKYSIATGIARSMHEQGAELAFAYQNERLLKNIKPIAEELGSEILIECDVSNDNSIDQAFKDLTKSIFNMEILKLEKPLGFLNSVLNYLFKFK